LQNTRLQCVQSCRHLQMFIININMPNDLVSIVYNVAVMHTQLIAYCHL